MESALESFEQAPSNQSQLLEYERMAKQHLQEYMKIVESRGSKERPNHNAYDDFPIASRRSSPKKQVMVEEVALEFFSQLMDRFRDFKEFCAATGNIEPDCAILETDWSSFGVITPWKSIVFVVYTYSN